MQQSAKEAEIEVDTTESTIKITEVMSTAEIIPAATIIMEEDDEEIMIID